MRNRGADDRMGVAGGIPLRYLRYEPARPVVAGLKHLEANLRCLLHEAHATGRLAVLPPLNLTPTHNADVRLDWKWETYYDFGASTIVDAAGEHPLPIAPFPPHGGTLVIGPRERMPAGHETYPLVVRTFNRPQAVHGRELGTGHWPAATVRLVAAAPVRELARHAVWRLASLDGGRFAAVHVRRGDRLGQYPRRLTEPEYIKKYLKRRRVADGSVVYIASDERSADFWKPLQSCYRLFRYVDFPKLVALIEPADDRLPDNYQLYQVERQIMGQARMWIETLPGGVTDEGGEHGSLVSNKRWKLRRWVRAEYTHYLRRLKSSRFVGQRSRRSGSRDTSPPSA